MSHAWISNFFFFKKNDDDTSSLSSSFLNSFSFFFSFWDQTKIKEMWYTRVFIYSKISISMIQSKFQFCLITQIISHYMYRFPIMCTKLINVNDSSTFLIKKESAFFTKTVILYITLHDHGHVREINVYGMLNSFILCCWDQQRRKDNYHKIYCLLIKTK